MTATLHSPYLTAFWILFRLLSFFPRLEILRLVCSIVASLAVNGMHYTGQAAATFNYVPNASASVASGSTADQATATTWAIIVSAVLLFVILIVSIADLRVWYYNTSAIIRELDIRATLATADPKCTTETFLASYNMIRCTDGSTKAIAEFRIKMKYSSQTSEGSGATGHKSSIVAITEDHFDHHSQTAEQTAIFTAADLESAAAAKT